MPHGPILPVLRRDRQKQDISGVRPQRLVTSVNWILLNKLHEQHGNDWAINIQTF